MGGTVAISAEVSWLCHIREPVVAHNEVSLAFFGAAAFDPVACAELGVRRPYVLHVGGRLPLATLVGLVAGAAAAVVPSRCEGFGLPALEAMAAGVPVVATARSSLPEVCGNAAVLVEPTPAGIADGIIDVLSGGADVAALAARGRARAAQFTWQESLGVHAQVYRSVWNGKADRP